MKALTCLLPLIFCVFAAHAQQPPSPERVAQQAAMQRLSFLIGQWEGSGWYDYEGQRMPFRSTEIVEARLDTLLLLVEGVHRADIPGRPEPVVVHQAFGVFSYDPEAQRYDFRTYLSGGQGGTFEAGWEDGALVWTMDHAQMGRVRYTIRMNSRGQWHEIGQRSADGAAWQQFFEMTLDRTGDAAAR